MVRSRDPPAYNANATRRKSICDYTSESLFDSATELKFDKHYDKYSSMEEDISTIDETTNIDFVETELLDPKLLEEARQCMLHYRAKASVERQLGVKLGPPGNSFGEEAQETVDAMMRQNCPGATNTAEVITTESRDPANDYQANYGKYNQPEMLHVTVECISAEHADTKAQKRVAKEEGTTSTVLNNLMVLPDAVEEDSGATQHHTRETLPGFWIHFFEFLTCALTGICIRSHGQSDIVGILEYEMPLQSVQDADDIGAWGLSDAEQASLQPRKFAKDIDFSSKRIDEGNACIALYDEVKLKQEVHTVEIPEEYFDYDEAADGVCEDLSFLESRGVPDAVVLEPKKADDVSVLEDDSVAESISTRKIRAWSLSPRRKRMLEEKAKAIASNI
jgi:hypothetical protein